MHPLITGLLTRGLTKDCSFSTGRAVLTAMSYVNRAPAPDLRVAIL